MKPQSLLLMLVAFLTFTSLTAQNSFYLGARGGVNNSKFQFSEDLMELYPTSNGAIGVNGGFDAGLQFNNWMVSTGLHYVQKGGRYQTDNFEENGEVGYFTANEKHHYVSVPLTLGYRDYLAPKVGYTLAGGPSFNFGVAGKLDEVTEYFGTDDVDIQNYKVAFGNGVNDDYRPMQVGFQLSPGLFIDVNERSKITLSATWDWSTADIFNPRYKDANEFFDTYKGDQMSQSAMFTIGYEYHFKFEDKY